MAENTEFFCQSAAAYLQAKLGIQTDYVSVIPWQEREQLFDCGEIQILWLCGLPYVHKVDLRESGMEPKCSGAIGLSVFRAAGVFFRRHRKRKEPLSKI
jgi:phosphonate transport system substrate-binding protein